MPLEEVTPKVYELAPHEKTKSNDRCIDLDVKVDSCRETIDFRCSRASDLSSMLPWIIALVMLYRTCLLRAICIQIMTQRLASRQRCQNLVRQ